MESLVSQSGCGVVATLAVPSWVFSKQWWHCRVGTDVLGRTIVGVFVFVEALFPFWKPFHLLCSEELSLLTSVLLVEE